MYTIQNNNNLITHVTASAESERLDCRISTNKIKAKGQYVYGPKTITNQSHQ